MIEHNTQLGEKWEIEKAQLESRGIFCCPVIDKGSQCRCMCRFTTKSACDKHISNPETRHRYPRASLTNWVHELHLSGKFAFSLAVGSRKNRSKFMNSERPLNIPTCQEYPVENFLVDGKWFEDGCYRKHRKPPFNATKALKADLEFLFLQGFEKDGPKQGRNKYTPEQAYIFLKNLKRSNGRRKYSHDPENKENGPLPTTLYMQGWFSRRKNKMAEEERRRAAKKSNSVETDHDDVELLQEEEGIRLEEEEEECQSDKELFTIDDSTATSYQSQTIVKLKSEAALRLKRAKFSSKELFAKLLKNDDILNKNNESIYNGRQESALKQMCEDRSLPSKISKDSLIYFLLHDDQVIKLKSCSTALKMVVMQHEVLEDTISLKRMQNKDD